MGRFVKLMFGNSLMLAGLSLCLAGYALETRAAEEGPVARRFVVLDTGSAWRMHHTLAMPMIAFDDGLKPVPPEGADAAQWRGILAAATPRPSADWIRPDFDDSRWVRGAAIGACRTPYLERLCLRGQFLVTDPAQVHGLQLAADFHGGVIVYLNGQEIVRRHLPAGALGQGALAEAYAKEAFVSEDDKLLTLRGNDPRLASVSAETTRRIKLRDRTVTVPLPSAQLRQGLNVVALEIVRAPYHRVVDEFKAVSVYKSNEKIHDLSWNTCEIVGVQLTADAAGGLVSGAFRPKSLQIWNSDPMATDFDLDLGNPAEPLRPIRLSGARNGSVSGKVVVGSPQALRGLQAVAGDLKSADGALIPAMAVTVRYATPWSDVPLTTEDNFEIVPYPGPVSPLLAILDAPQSEFPVRGQAAAEQPAASRAATYLQVSGGPASFAGAVVPVWVTVRVPRDAKPARYAGLITVQAEGQKPVEVAVELQVLDYVLPDPKDFRTWVELVQSPDTLAVQYDLPLWSDRHFEMMAQSMKHLHDLGSRVIYVPLVAQTNFGNAETMVRWIKKGDGSYDFDFSIMDRYLDLVGKHMDPPKFVVFMAWDLHLAAGGSGPRAQYASRAVGKQPLVTLVDPATGKTENVHLPAYEDAGGKEPWVRLFAQLRERMQKRGLEKTMLLGMLSDVWPSKEQTAALKEISGDLPWSIAAHGNYWQQSKPLHDMAAIGYNVHAFGTQFGYERSLMGWKNPVLHVAFERWNNIPHTALVRWRDFPELCITGSVRGIARLGGDFWPVDVKGRGGRVTRAQVWARYPESNLNQLSLKTSLLAPGPQGPVSSARFEAFREGLQESEARIVIEEALSDAALRQKLDPELAKRCEAALAERQNCMMRSLSPLQVGPAACHSFAAWRGVSTCVTGYTWYLSSGWQERSELLFTLAGEVQRFLAAK